MMEVTNLPGIKFYNSLYESGFTLDSLSLFVVAVA